ncbi:mediator of RNA polymerase II transcription subunit 9 [Tetranychus urticae]|uniref:Mediator of RNA polymerase II transcription subunit 9 n=1 Tax=Tetranychus urticae TaxID=32264 RepID=T1KUX7_TETUR|nr:mediator of RNA polymerase II transcription subunit 9 [Tetranychus urticae]
MASNNSNNNNNSSTPNIKLEDIDFEFLPLIYDIIRSIEKELNEGSSVGQKAIHREQTEIPAKMQLLNDKFKKCREQLMKIEGIDITKEQQLKQLENLSKQLDMKRQLLTQYKNFSPIESSSQMHT